jgi:exopolyphosphatase/guanosine-5'-triphosphate,3'-diphosphate pyrophosphatase
MPSPITTSNRSIVAFMDIGTNAIRMMVARLGANSQYQVLDQRRQAVRLGEDVFNGGLLPPAVMNRIALLCRQWIKAAHAIGAGEIVAVATSATREARNRRAFLRLLRTRTGIDVRVLSGKEEARLIYLGVSSAMKLGTRQALIVDIGGGSTEIIIGDCKAPHYLAMLKLGAIRLSNRYLRANPEQPVTPAQYERIREYVRTSSHNVLHQLRRHRMDIMIGSSGTILSLGDIAARHWTKQPLQCPAIVSTTRLRQVIRQLCALPITRRRQIPGLQPDRADIIIGGAAILDAILEELKIRSIVISERSLRDGLVIDYQRSRNTGS